MHWTWWTLIFVILSASDGRVIRRRSSCSTETDNIVAERNEALIVLTGRVEGVIHYFPAKGLLLTTNADTDIDGYEWNPVPGSEPENRHSNRTARAAVHVRVKRVIKGDRGLEKSVIVVDGIEGGSERFCMSRLRVRDTRIFMLNLDVDGTFVLASKPLMLTLDNLRNVNQPGPALRSGLRENMDWAERGGHFVFKLNDEDGLWYPNLNCPLQIPHRYFMLHQGGRPLQQEMR